MLLLRQSVVLIFEITAFCGKYKKLKKQEEVKKMKKVKEGQIITIDGIQYRIGPTTAEAINIWLEVLEEEPDAEQMIELYRTETDITRGYRSNMVAVSKIKAALEKLS